jgi:N-acetyl-beta-hexosaminidase
MSDSKFRVASSPARIARGLDLVREAFPSRFGPGGLALSFEEKPEPGLRVEKSSDGTRVLFHRPVEAFRALGLIMGSAGAGVSDFAQFSRVERLAVMIDASRNGACTIDALRDLILRAALMGIDGAMLYMEDTYEVPGEDFFGYLRGPYSADELRGLDDYAFALGVELSPCIQTLGHLEQILQWPAYEALRDDERIVLAGSPATYELLAKMIQAASAPFRSRRINLGMDEASGIGQGNYKRLFGDRRPFDIMNDHLAKVRDICSSLGLEASIWSDMYFRLGSATHGYYDKDWRLPEGVAERIPKDVQLVYWDYYHEDYVFYREWIAHHRELGTEPAVALGSWCWDRFWSELVFATKTIVPGMRACRDEGIREVILTNWGDDGMEVDIRSALPAWQLFAECAYSGDDSLAEVESAAALGFRGSVGGDYASWVAASGLDRLPGAAEKHANPSKVLLYEDLLLGLWEPQYQVESLPAHYAALASRLETAASAGGADSRLAFPAKIARVLAAKTALRPRLVKAYRVGDREALTRMAEAELPALLAEVEELWRMHRELWLSTYRPFGLEVIDMRYGFVRARIEGLELRLEGYLSGATRSIPELETDLKAIYPVVASEAPEIYGFRRIASPSRIV